MYRKDILVICALEGIEQHEKQKPHDRSFSDPARTYQLKNILSKSLTNQRGRRYWSFGHSPTAILLT